MIMTNVLETVAEQAGIKKIGILSHGDFMSLLPSGGKVKQHYRDGSELIELSAQIQCRGTDQRTLISSLEAAADDMINADYNSTGYQILKITKGQLPMPITADESGNYIYGRGIVIKYFSPKA